MRLPWKDLSSLVAERKLLARPSSPKPVVVTETHTADSSGEFFLDLPLARPVRVMQHLPEGGLRELEKDEEYEVRVDQADPQAKTNICLRQPSSLPPETRFSVEYVRIPDWSLATIRPAQESDVEAISSWASPHEVPWLGGDLDRPLASQLNQWISEAYGSYVLLYSNTPVGFINVAPLECGHSLAELGRLLISPSWRRLGFGSVLVHHLGLSTIQLGEHSYATPPRLVARATPANEGGLGVLRKLPFRAISDAQLLAAGSSYRWFEYLIRSRALVFGEAIRKARRERNLSQAMLAFYCGVTRTTINMIEAGHRSPSLDLLQRLADVLFLDPLPKIEFLLSTLGESRSPRLRLDLQLEEEAPNANVNVWVIADALAEFQSSRFLEETERALVGGYHRWYFLPAASLDREGIVLRKLLSDRLGEQVVSKQVRLFQAPEILCQLRIAIYNPESVSGARATVEGEGGSRATLSARGTEYLIRIIQSEVRQAELGISRATPSLFIEYLEQVNENRAEFRLARV